jgi:hypothetical protein
MTLVLSDPGATLSTVGPLSFDAFWISLSVCGTLILSVFALDEYNAEEYGLDSQKRNK